MEYTTLSLVASTLLLAAPAPAAAKAQNALTAEVQEVRKPCPWMARIADDKPIVVSCVRDGALTVHNAQTGETLRTIEDPVSGADIWRIDVDRSGELVAMLTRDNRVWYWSWKTDEAPVAVATLPGTTTTWTGWRFGAVLEFGPAGKRLLAGHGHGGMVLFDRDGEAVLSLGGAVQPPPGEATEDGWRTVRAGGFDVARAWSKNGDRIALTTADGPVLFDTTTAEPLRSGFGPANARVESLALSPDGARLLTGCYGGEMTAYDIETREEAWATTFTTPLWGGHDPAWNPIGVGDIKFSPDGALVAATINTSIHAFLVDAASGRQQWSGPHCGGRMGEPAAIVWSATGDSFFHAYVSGVMKIQHVKLSKDPKHGLAGQVPRMRGTLPDFGWEGIGVFIGDGALHAVKGPRFQALWRRDL